MAYSPSVVCVFQAQNKALKWPRALEEGEVKMFGDWL